MQQTQEGFNALVANTGEFICFPPPTVLLLIYSQSHLPPAHPYHCTGALNNMMTLSPSSHIGIGISDVPTHGGLSLTVNMSVVSTRQDPRPHLEPPPLTVCLALRK